MRTATKKAATFGATLWVPEFLRFEKFEMQTLLGILREPLAVHTYFLLVAHADFETGEFNGGYHRLQELMTPPQPERGARMPGPTIRQIRRVVDDLIGLALATRNGIQNALQGELRLQLTPRKKKATPEQLQVRVEGRVQQAAKQAPMRVSEESGEHSSQVSGHGSQGFNTSFNGSTDSDLSTTAGGITRPPEGAQKGPHGQAPGQVEASPLMAETASAVSDEVKQARRAKVAELKRLNALKQPSISGRGIREESTAGAG